MKKLNYKELLEEINNAQHVQEKLIVDLYNIGISSTANIEEFERLDNKSAVMALRNIGRILWNECVKNIKSYIDNFSKDAFDNYCTNNGLDTLYNLYTAYTNNEGDNNND